MEVIPRKAVLAAACALVALAVLGAYQGWRRSAVEEAQTAADGSLLPTTAAVSGAKTASALVETPTTLNDAQIREIARQEVRAALRGDSASSSESAPAKAAATPPSGATAATATPTPPRPTIGPAPTLQAPTPAAPAEPAGQAAPLF